MATRVITTVLSLTPQELQAELMGLLLMSSHEGIGEISFTSALASLRGTVGETERILVSANELTEAAQDLQRKKLLIYQRGVLSLPG